MPSARQNRPEGAGFVIRFERGSRSNPHLAGHFLGWVGGNFIPCSNEGIATPYAARHIARGVAMRAEHAFPGARFDVVQVQH